MWIISEGHSRAFLIKDDTKVLSPSECPDVFFRDNLYMYLHVLVQHAVCTVHSGIRNSKEAMKLSLPYY